MKNEAPGKMRFHLVEETLGAKIRVIGIGGGGGNALNRMIAAGIDGVDFIAVNTDMQALNGSKAPTRIQIGNQSTRGLGSGGKPEAGKQAAMEDTEKLIELLEGSDMVLPPGWAAARAREPAPSWPTWPPSWTSWPSPSAPCPSSSRAACGPSRPKRGSTSCGPPWTRSSPSPTSGSSRR